MGLFKSWKKQEVQEKAAFSPVSGEIVPLESIGDKTFRISLRNRETIGEVMTALQEIIPITIERIDKDIYIRE